MTKKLIFIPILVLILSCQNTKTKQIEANGAIEVNSTEQKEKLVNQIEDKDTLISILSDFKGRWILTDYFSEVKNKREFMTVNDYPSSWFAEIEIKSDTIIPKGWHEHAEIDFKVLTPTKIRTTYPSQYFIIELDTIKNVISTQLIERNEPKWKHEYSRKPEGVDTDITRLKDMIFQNCLIGSYRDLAKGSMININQDFIGQTAYSIQTDYEHVCGLYNLIQVSADSSFTAHWEWVSDTLRIFHLTQTFEQEGCATYKKTKMIKELLLTTKNIGHLADSAKFEHVNN